MGRLRFKPGVFDYSGFGLGTYWDRNGESHWVTTTEASMLAKHERLEIVWVDRLEGASSYTPNWRQHLASQQNVDSKNRC